MPDRLDADTSLLYVVDGQPLPEEPPGFATFSPPRRSARGREKDTLFLCLGLRSRRPVSLERYGGLLQLGATTFFGSPGSVTSALRQAVAAVNQDLLDHNLREGAGGTPVQGGLICAALRGLDFYAVQCGPGLILVAHGAAVERFPNLPSRPLGLSNHLDAHYFHTTVQQAEYFVLSRQAHSGWSPVALAGLGELATLTHVAQRLKDSSSDDIAAMVGRFEPGGVALVPQPAPMPAVGTATPENARPPRADSRPLVAGLRSGLASLASYFRPSPPGEQAAHPPATSTQPLAQDGADSASVREPKPQQSPVQPEEAAPTAPVVVEAAAASANVPGTDWPDLLRRAERWGDAEPMPSIPVIEALPPRDDLSIPTTASAAPALEAAPGPASVVAEGLQSVAPRAERSLRAVGRALGVTLTESVRGLRALIARMLPEGMLQREGLFTIPTSIQIAMAIVTPLVVVGVVAVVYIQRGRAEQFSDTLSRAQFEVATARVLSDPLAARPHWEAALEWLAQAEALRPGEGRVADLRREAQGQLDELDWVTRLDYQPLVVGGLGRNVRVRQIALVGQDVYALDEANQRVMRVTPSPNGLGYVVDADFACASGQIGEFRISDLVDIGLLPSPNVIGTEAIVALDTAGGLLYCAPEAAPLATYLPAPDTNWIRPTALKVYADRLYVLDPGGNEVWQFVASGGAFNQAPIRYFTGAAYDLQDVIDFSIAGGDLFLLRSDGRVTNCSRPATGEAATCVESVEFTDSRPGRAAGGRLADMSAPVRLVYDPPPEPSLYLLETRLDAIYQLSLRLVFVRQYRPRFSLGAAITSAAVDPAKQFYVGAGDNIYVAKRP